MQTQLAIWRISLYSVVIDGDPNFSITRACHDFRGLAAIPKYRMLERRVRRAWDREMAGLATSNGAILIGRRMHELAMLASFHAGLAKGRRAWLIVKWLRPVHAMLWVAGGWRNKRRLNSTCEWEKSEGLPNWDLAHQGLQ
jgi:hypothetical protein